MVLPRLLVGVLAVLSTGCATIGTWNETRCEWGFPYVYRGTVLDIVAPIKAATSGNEASIGALLIFDLPLSLVADTLALPVAAYRDLREDCGGSGPAPGAP